MENILSQPQILCDFLTEMNLDSSRLHVHSSVIESLGYDFEIQTADFIKFAELDLQQNSAHGLVNALSNAKRAIDCQVDTVLGCFGLLSRRNLPQKIELLRNMGMVTPRIVTKVVKARNYLEHEFTMPKRELVEDAVDIATLFTTLLSRALRNFNSGFYISTVVEGIYDDGDPYHDKWISVDFDDEVLQFELQGVIFIEPPTPESRKTRRVGPIYIKSHDKGYIELINLAFSLNDSIAKEEVNQRAIQFLNLASMAKT
jgi:hypothetical protein